MTGNRSSPIPAADFGSRFAAFMIDAALLFSVQWIVFIVLARQLQAAGMTSQAPCSDNLERLCEGPSNLLWAILLLLLIGSTVAYHAVFEGLYGATPGKRWMGLRVVRAASGSVAADGPIGLPAGTTRSVVRQAFWLSLFFIFDASPLAISLPPGLFILVPILAFGLTAWAGFAADGRGVHDIVADTLVVRSDDVRPEALPVVPDDVSIVHDQEDHEPKTDHRDHDHDEEEVV